MHQNTFPSIFVSVAHKYMQTSSALKPYVTLNTLTIPKNVKTRCFSVKISKTAFIRLPSGFRNL